MRRAGWRYGVMLNDSTARGAHIYVACGYTDLRGIVEREFRLDLFSDNDYRMNGSAT